MGCCVGALIYIARGCVYGSPVLMWDAIREAGRAEQRTPK
jgi:hypothetical protein